CQQEIKLLIKFRQRCLSPTIRGGLAPVPVEALAVWKASIATVKGWFAGSPLTVGDAVPATDGDMESMSGLNFPRRRG
ncbi:MAG: hypothetical protein R6V45_11495, partial [Oceanipulchritudo sp.]